jgi:regulator of nucleoside diphosphate kinase
MAGACAGNAPIFYPAGANMRKRKICITKQDHARLGELLLVSANQRERSDLAELAAELGRATILEEKDIPSSLVTMNSKIVLKDLDTGEKMVFTLVYPDEANIEAGKISVISPIGTAVLGYAAGDEISWNVPAGKRRIKIVEVLFQPEAAGNR